MIRHTLSVVTAAALAAVVGAQGPKGPLPPQRAELFKKNRMVIEKLVDHTLESSRDRNDNVKVAKSYYAILYQFSTDIAEAARNRDTARVEELTRHLETILDKGLAPTLVEARKQVENGTGNEEYRKVKDDLLAQVDALHKILGDNPTARASLDQARKRLDEINGPKKK